MVDDSDIPRYRSHRLIESTDIAIIATLIGWTLAALSPGPIKWMFGRDPFILALSFNGYFWCVSVVALVKGLYLLLIRWKRPLKERLALALIYPLLVTFAYEVGSIGDWAKFERTEHAWNWAWSLTLQPVNQIESSTECGNFSGKNAVVIASRLTWNDQCISQIIQYDSAENPLCSRYFEENPTRLAKLPRITKNGDGLSMSQMQVLHHLTSVLVCDF